jgi:transposase
VAQLEQRMQLLLQRIYGPRAERIDPNQLPLFGEEVSEQGLKAEPETEPEGAPETPKRRGHGRKRPSRELKRVRLEHDVPEAEKFCAGCNMEKKRIGEEISEQIEYEPASLFVIENVQPKYACPCCQEGVIMAKKPAQPIEKGLPGPGLIAHVAVSKYCDHTPLYRQESQLARQGANLSRKTLCGWVLAAADLLAPVVERMKAGLLASKVIHTDDTPIRVQDNGDGPYTGRFWVYLGDGAHPYTVYDYTPSRRRDGPMTFLEVFKGTQEQPRYLQADAFGGYDVLYEKDSGVLEVACWAHCRRKFHEARNTDVVRAHQMLGWVRLLYRIETEAKEFCPQDRYALRQEKARPVLDDIGEWLLAEYPRVLPKSPIGEAVQYALNQWNALKRYLDDGDLAIDNNAAENAIRPIALGRKNYLFLGSDRGGRAAACFYSLIASAKRHGIEPFFYLRDLLLRIRTHPQDRLEELLPDSWKRQIVQG